jgi:hypothetical protein
MSMGFAKWDDEKIEGRGADSGVFIGGGSSNSKMYARYKKMSRLKINSSSPQMKICICPSCGLRLSTDEKINMKCISCDARWEI